MLCPICSLHYVESDNKCLDTGEIIDMGVWRTCNGCEETVDIQTTGVWSCEDCEETLCRSCHDIPELCLAMVWACEGKGCVVYDMWDMYKDKLKKRKTKKR